MNLSKKQVLQFNNMLATLNVIAKGYQTPKQLKKSSKKDFGLDYEECLECAYENMQQEAKNVIKFVKPIPETSL